MMSRSVLAARGRWTEDFGGEQFTLGRAFYTHLETGRAREYFAQVRCSDETVEAVLPGIQARVRDLLACMVAGKTRARPGFCGPGVHVFPAGEKVSRHGGVIHSDIEGLTPFHIQKRARALSLVIALQSPVRAESLRLWDLLTADDHSLTDRETESASIVVRYRPGDALLFDSYRVHQIQPFGGRLDRISITAHAVEVDRDMWEVWF
jgi:hypothetical protein